MNASHLSALAESISDTSVAIATLERRVKYFKEQQISNAHLDTLFPYQVHGKKATSTAYYDHHIDIAQRTISRLKTSIRLRAQEIVDSVDQRGVCEHCYQQRERNQLHRVDTSDLTNIAGTHLIVCDMCLPLHS